MFAERGVSATLNDVARAAGVGVGTVYRKFADKDAVLDALFDGKVEALLDLADEASAIDHAGVAIRTLLLGVMAKRASDRGLDVILTASGRTDRFTQQLGVKFLPKVDRLIARAVEAGELREGFTAPEVCMLGFMVGKVADITGVENPEAWRRYAQLLIDGTRLAAATTTLSPAPLPFPEIAAALARSN